MLYLFRDDFLGEQRLARLRASLGPADVQGLNTSVLDGQRLTLGELRAAADALPFLGERRLVVVRRLFSALGRGANAAEGSNARRGRADDREAEILAYLDQVPPTTDLVLLEDADFRANHPAVKRVQKLGGEVVLGGMPRGDELIRWIRQRVPEKGGQIEPRAAAQLAELGVGDLRQLDLALDALVAYAAERAIGPADVRELVPQSRAADVFQLVDAVGARDRRAALEVYRHLVADDVSPVYLLVMLTRQFRLLLSAREAQQAGEDLAGALEVSPWVAQKLGQQARQYRVERCVAAYDKLVRTDLAIKTGEADETIAVELLIMELTER
jgi:DNA polymerase-3 subunit delta